MSQTLVDFQRNTSNAVVQLNLCYVGVGKKNGLVSEKLENGLNRSHSGLQCIENPDDELDGCACLIVGGEPKMANTARCNTDMSFNGDGSLPPTPPSPRTPDCEFPSAVVPNLDAVKCGLLKDELYQQTFYLIMDYFKEYAGCGGCTKTNGLNLISIGSLNKAAETLRKICGQLMDKHQLAFKGATQKLVIKNEDDLKIVRSISSEVFKDGITNWGRIATVIAFGAFLSRHLKEVHMENCVDGVAKCIADFLVQEKRDWLVKHQSWDGFVEFFHLEDPESSVRNVLMAFAGVAGLGAGLAYMIR
ncbi:induced myeloid leukemia cell differentiation protein Mcl-1 homolog [Protopterus annectens]|uniref:induced myeloid leukemia cell differentiation protein Mcl-1 homolog n=1 Tax=Protopterus annectens TaxID=7888 RepID=UPI001CFB3C64|nr:induced myeloid leukemia cell differentiation protein Mcl-1 homolog [Protopterus annectens]